MDSHIKNKMYNLEIPAPAGTWELLANRLDQEEQDQRIALKMEGLAIAAPPGIWDSISRQLEEAEEAPLPQIKSDTRVIGFRKWLAAASLVGLFLVSYFFLTRKNSSELANGSELTSPATTTPANSNSQNNLTDTGTNSLAETRPLLAAVSSVYLGRPRTKKSPQNDGLINISSRSQVVEKAHGNDYPAATNAIQKDADRYFNLLDENGNLVRVSKKLSSLECVIKNGLAVPLSDANMKEDEECLDQVREWHKVMTSSPAITSPLDLLEVISKG